MKNLAFVIESLHLGGAEKSLVTLLQNLDYKQFKVDLIIFVAGGVFENEVPKQVNVLRDLYPKINIVKRIRYKILKLIFGSKFHPSQLFWMTTRSQFRKVKKEYDVAIAYSQGLATYFVEQCIDAEKKYSWLNTDYQKAGYNIQFDFKFYRNFDKVITVSAEAFQSFNQVLNLNQLVLNQEIIQDIVDRKYICKRAEVDEDNVFDKETTNILTVCRLAEEKGLPLAIKSCKMLIDQGHKVHWYVVGEGDERQFLQSLIKQNGVGQHFTLVGLRANPYPLIKNCDIYVQTSLYEGLGIALIEACCLNKPIVTTNFPTAYGILEENQTGLIAEMNVCSIAEKVGLLIDDENLRNCLVKNLSNQKDLYKNDSLKKINKLIELEY